MPTSRRATKAEAETTAQVKIAVDDVSNALASPAQKAIAKVQAAVEDVADVASKVMVATPNVSHRPSKISPVLQFPFAATLSFAMASLGYSLLGELTKGELASVSRSQDTWGEVGVLAGWRLVELAIGWFGNLDSLDVATLDLLSHGPSLYLLTTFYNLSPITAWSALVVDILSAAVPFYLLRPLSAVHTRSAKLPNRDLADWGVQIFTAVLSAAIYTVTIVISLHHLLPRIFVVHFGDIPTVEPAYMATYAAVLPVTLLFGAAASNFIFAPFATTGKAKEDDRIGEFDPASASLGETVEMNLWGYTAKTKVAIRRTAVACFVTAINTYLACTMTIYGIDSTGAGSYAGVWVFAVLCSGLGLGLVDGE